MHCTREVLTTTYLSFFCSHTRLHPTARLNKTYTISGVLSMAMNLTYNTRTGKNRSSSLMNTYSVLKTNLQLIYGIRGCHAMCRVNRRRRTETSASVNLAHSVTSQNAGNLKPRAINKLRTSYPNVGGICFFFGKVYGTYHQFHASI